MIYHLGNPGGKKSAPPENISHRSYLKFKLKSSFKKVYKVKRTSTHTKKKKQVLPQEVRNHPNNPLPVSIFHPWSCPNLHHLRSCNVHLTFHAGQGMGGHSDEDVHSCIRNKMVQMLKLQILTILAIQFTCL